MLSEENRAIIAADNSRVRALADRHPRILERLMNAVREEEREKVREMLAEIHDLAEQGLNGGDIVQVRRLEDISDATLPIRQAKEADHDR